MKYRKEIDGLRAVAVIPVILYHAGFQSFSGGYVGVDIFFVISGYLITTIILSEKESNSFSIVNFYERRARRILPALFVVMLVSLVLSWFLLLPSEMKKFTDSLIGVSVFSSNILFWQGSDYFGIGNEMKPLLHTWSLAVEEQYYILFPIFLGVIWKLRKRWIFTMLLLTGVTSLVLAEWGTVNYPKATFYLLPTRAWELMVGALVAFYTIYRQKQPAIVHDNMALSQFMGLLGLAMISYAIVALDKTTPFPGLYALYPTLGAALIIIFTSSKTIVGRLLGSKILVWTGIISYSTYLWHQPLFAFSRQYSLTELSKFDYITLAAASLFLGYVSWRYIETPFRSKQRINRKNILIFGIAGSLFFIVVGLLSNHFNGFNKRISSNGTVLNDLDVRTRFNYGLSKKCGRGTIQLLKACRTSDVPEILIWGDSFAKHLIQGFLASEPSIKLIQMTKGACAPFKNLTYRQVRQNSNKWSEECFVFNRNVLKWLRNQSSVKYVVMSSPYEQYLKPKNKLIIDQKVIDVDIEKVYRAFVNTLDSIKDTGVTPVIFSPPPSTGNNLAMCLKAATIREVELSVCDFFEKDISDVRIQIYSLLKRLEGLGYSVVWLNKMICKEGICKPSNDSKFIYRDNGHLSYEGSAYLGVKYGFYNLVVGNK